MTKLDKKSLRQQIAAQKRALRPAQIEAASEDLTRQLFAHPAYLRARSVYGYLNYNQEVSTGALLRRAQADGKRVAVSKILDGEMRFIWLDDLSQVAPGYRGIPEPIADEPEADDPDALVLTPGLAFTERGQRLGYGGGFYDRFLKKQRHPTIALCYAFQLVPALPSEAHDIPVDFVLTAKTGE